MTLKPRKARGSIEQRADRWYLRAAIERVDKASGATTAHRGRIFLGDRSTLRSQASARRAADRWLARNQPAELRAGEIVLFAEFAEQFMRLVVPRLRKSSQRRYRSTIRTHLVPALGSVPLAQLTERRLQELLITLGNGRRRATVMGIRALLLQILRQARAEGLDVAELDPKLILPPRDNAPAPEAVHINATQLARILEASEHPWRALWATMGYAALRCGEALGLAWSHVDLAAGAIRVRRSVSIGEIGPTKTRLSASDVPIAPPLVDLLTEYRERWKPNSDGLLWANTRGKPLNADKVRERRWRPLLARLGLPRCGLHALRHGTASRLFELGCDALTVQRVLRHRSLELTQRYSHAPFKQLKDAVNSAYRTNRNTQP